MSFGKINKIFKKIKSTYYPIGSYIITRTNQNPASFLGIGTWVLKDKKLDPARIPQDIITFNNTNTTEGSHAWFTDGRCLWLKMQWITKVALSDSTVEIATLDFSKIDNSGTLVPLSGLDKMGFLVGVPSGIIINWSDITDQQITIYVQQVIHRQGTRSFTNTSYYTYLSIPMRLDPTFFNFNDQLCNQFYWLRID